MLIIECPWCGRRDEDEFTFGGAVDKTRPLDTLSLSDQEWAQYLFMRDNVRGSSLERWRHTFGCGQWFACERHSVTHQITRVCTLDEIRASAGTDIASMPAVMNSAQERCE